MPFLVLSWEAESPVTEADDAVRKAVEAAGPDWDDVEYVLLRTVIFKNAGVNLAKLHNALDDAIAVGPLRRYWLLQCNAGAHCGGWLHHEVDLAKAKKIVGGTNFPTNRRTN